MVSRVMLAMAFVFTSTAVLATVKECDERCEKRYKYCITSGKASNKVCLVEREKCRKSCIKAAK